ncbi:hypothetical protein BJ166DRAFT_525531 [Pestalotiopsis sp. NC0098]|nr:hypothetical protein BJ166DRAFT_525531 [Pestalotiopsis sp. NC0098]
MILHCDSGCFKPENPPDKAQRTQVQGTTSTVRSITPIIFHTCIFQKVYGIDCIPLGPSQDILTGEIRSTKQCQCIKITRLIQFARGFFTSDEMELPPRAAANNLVFISLALALCVYPQQREHGSADEILSRNKNKNKLSATDARRKHGQGKEGIALSGQEETSSLFTFSPWLFFSSGHVRGKSPDCQMARPPRPEIRLATSSQITTMTSDNVHTCIGADRITEVS